jgi:hypothetical protein
MLVHRGFVIFYLSFLRRTLLVELQNFIYFTYFYLHIPTSDSARDRSLSHNSNTESWFRVLWLFWVFDLVAPCLSALVCRSLVFRVFVPSVCRPPAPRSSVHWILIFRVVECWISVFAACCQLVHRRLIPHSSIVLVSG